MPEEELCGYADRELAPPFFWSVEAHLARCPHCRQRLAAVVGPELVTAGWARLDAELDAPVPGWMERLMMRLGVGDHTARLLAATPALRLSWLAAVALTLTLTVVLAALAHPAVFLVVVPLLSLAGVAASFGPGVDPTYEMALVAPTHMFRLLLLRCTAVLSANAALAAVASLALPEFGLEALGWFLPALVLTVLTLTLTPRLGPVYAAGTVGLGWLALVVLSATSGAGGLIVFTPAGQFIAVLIGAAAAALLLRLRPAFETSRYRKVPWSSR